MAEGTDAHQTESAPPRTPFGGLLELQDHDTAADQLRHRRATLPERARLAEVEARLGELAGRLRGASDERAEHANKQANLEHQIDASKTRKAELEKRMYAGTVTAARELQAMDEEVRHLGRHISDLEDRELELMEAIEPIDATIAGLDQEALRLRAANAAAEADIVAELDKLATERAMLAASVVPALLTRYEQLRTKLGGTGAARLVGDSCSGCHLRLPAMEVDRIRKAAADEVITCDQCGRILVR